MLILAYTKKGSNGTSIDIKISLVVKGVTLKKIEIGTRPESDNSWQLQKTHHNY